MGRRPIVYRDSEGSRIGNDNILVAIGDLVQAPLFLGLPFAVAALPQIRSSQSDGLTRKASPEHHERNDSLSHNANCVCLNLDTRILLFCRPFSSPKRRVFL